MIKNLFSFACAVFITTIAMAQKKPLTHDVYDSWKSVQERVVSDDGSYVAYTIGEQQGDGILYVQDAAGNRKFSIDRAEKVKFSADSKYIIANIKPTYKETRDAKIKKKKKDEMPKDTLLILTLSNFAAEKIANVKSYKTPEKSAAVMAYLNEAPEVKKEKAAPIKKDSLTLQLDKYAKLMDSIIRKAIDSTKGKIEKEALIKVANNAAKKIIKEAKDDLDVEASLWLAPGDKDEVKEGNILVLRTAGDSIGKSFPYISDYLFDEQANYLLMSATKYKADSNSKASILLYNIATATTDTILAGFNDAKGFSFSEDGKHLAFIAERDSVEKSLQKFYKLYYYNHAGDSAKLIAENISPEFTKGSAISPTTKLNFSKDGKKLFFDIIPRPRIKDTMLVDFELARLDVWHYNDDYLQPQQLKQLSSPNPSTKAVVYYNTNSGKLLQVNKDFEEDVTLVDEGNGDWVLSRNNAGNRISSQWEGRSRSIASIIDLRTGNKKTVESAGYNFYQPSPQGKYVFWYNPETKNYYTYNVTTGAKNNVTAAIKEPLYDVENDVPDFARPVGVVGWTADDKYVLVQDNYDIWRVDPDGKQAPVNATYGFGQKHNVQFDYVNPDRDKRWIEEEDELLLSVKNKYDRQAGFAKMKLADKKGPTQLVLGPSDYSRPVKAKDANTWLVQKSDITASELMISSDMKTMQQLTNVAAQQEPYNWLTAEMMRWKMLDGKMSEGILYKPANFDPNKKYPVIFYFYEKNADNLYNYKTPAPSASTINIPWFVSNGYIVFDPNIYYKDGEPGESAFNSVVSAARALSKNKWIDSTRMAIQGQSWGGYQVAHLITRTNMFRAAGAGAPVANMTSAYGGIRWGSGLNRQFQYEKTQSRIGATLWERRDLYIKNSPLFFADKIKTPLLIMHNDEDGSVPWYQGIEYFTALRRLGKQVWMLQCNGEDHNLVERKNRKDLSIRLGQFFDHYLKDAPAADWIKYGVPATAKGYSWGLEVE